MPPAITGGSALNFTNKHGIKSAAEWAAAWQRIHGEAIPTDRAERIWAKVLSIKAAVARDRDILSTFFGGRA